MKAIGNTLSPDPGRILVFIPAYNCERQLKRVLAQFDADTQRLFSGVIVVDNCSPDGTAAAAVEGLNALPLVHGAVLRNKQNYGLGGSHKVAFNYAIDHGYDYCVVLHGDDQANIQDVVELLKAGAHRRVDCLLGARFMRGSRLSGYSALRTLGNRAFNLLFSVVCRRALYDLGSGLNVYSTAYLRPREYLRYADDLTFNYYSILSAVAGGATFEFFPLSWREEDQVSNVKVARQAWKMVKILASFAASRRRFVRTCHAANAGEYSALVVHETRPRTAGAA